MRSLQLFVHVLLLLAITPLYAEEDDLSELQQEIQILRREVKALRTRIETLEVKRESATATTRSGEAPPSSAKAAATAVARGDNIADLKIRWSHVEQGMTGAEVADAIGEPAAKLTLDGRPVWYYIYAAVGRGSVVFDGGGRVSSLQAPAFGWSW